MALVDDARRAVPGEDVLAAGIFNVVPGTSGGLPLRRLAVLIVTPSRVHLFDARARLTSWKLGESLGAWERSAIRVSVDGSAAGAGVTIEVPRQGGRVELKVMKSPATGADTVIPALTSGIPLGAERIPAGPPSDPIAVERARENKARAGMLAVVAGLLRAGAYFLPWVTITGSTTVALRGGAGGAPLFSIVFSLALVVVAIQYLAGRSEGAPRLLRSLAVGSVIASLVNFGYLMNQIGDARSELLSRGYHVTVSMGIGPWVQLAAAVLAAVAGVWAVRITEQLRPGPRSPYAPPAAVA